MSRAWLAVFLCLAVLSVAAGPVAGQGQTPFFRIEAQDAESKTISRDHGSAELHFNVSVVSQAPAPLAERFVIRLDVTMEPASPPNGFALGIGAPDQPNNPCPGGKSCSVTAPPGQRIRFVVTVSNTQTDPDKPAVEVKLRYRSTPSYTGSPDPVTAALVQQMGQTHQAEAKGTVSLDLDASERLATFVRQYPIPLLAAAGGILALGVVLVRKGKGGIGVSTESPIQEVLPGRGASFPVQVTNEGRQKESLSLTTSEVPQGWSAILPVERIELGANEATTIWLTLKAPQNAAPGQHVQLNFVATTQSGNTAEALVEAVVVERYGGRPSAPIGSAPATPEPAAEEAPDVAMEEPQVARVAAKRRRN